MDHMTQSLALEARDGGRIDIVRTADGDTSRSPELATAEFGSGWYHDAEIAASARILPAQKH